MNTTDFKSKYNNGSTGLFMDNSSGDIGANDARSLVVDVGDNFVNKETDGFYATGTTSGTGNIYGVTLVPVPPGYVNGHRYTLKFHAASTGAATLNLNALGPKKIFKNPTTQAGNGDIILNQTYNLSYDSTLDSAAGGFIILGAPATGVGGSQDLEDVLTLSNDAGGLAIVNMATPTNTNDAATKGYVDSEIGAISTSQDLTSVLGIGNDAGGTTIENLGAPVNGTDAATKDYADSIADNGQLADFTTLTDAAPVEVDCNSLKEPKFYLETGTSRTLNITEFRANSVLNNYSTILFIIKKTVPGDITITLDTDYTNKDYETPDTAVTSFTLTGADESYFKITGIARGEASGCIIWWNLAAESSGGGGGVSDWGDIGGTLSDQTDLQSALDGKQDSLVSGTNIKTVNGNSLVGSGDLDFIDDAVVNGVTTKAPSQNAVYDLLYTTRVQTVTSASTVTPNADTDDFVNITAQAAGLTLANPTGTPGDAQMIVIRIKDNGTARSITFGTEYRAIGLGLSLPTTTVISKTMYIVCVRNNTDTKWDVVNVMQQA